MELRSAHNQGATKITHVARTSRTATVCAFLDVDQTRLHLTAARGLTWVPETPTFLAPWNLRFPSNGSRHTNPGRASNRKKHTTLGWLSSSAVGIPARVRKVRLAPIYPLYQNLHARKCCADYTCMCAQAGTLSRSSRSRPSTRTSSMWPTYVSLPLLALAPPPPPPPAPHAYASAISRAQRCIKLLADKFPDSPRVSCLIGIRMEATEPPETALKYYDDLLETDPANSVCISFFFLHPFTPSHLSRSLRKTRRR